MATVDLAGLDMLYKSIGIGIPAAVVILTFLIVSLFVKTIGSKQDKDRAEHMQKWESMIEMQKGAVDRQAETMTLVVNNNKDELNRIMNSHADEFQRLYKLYEAQSGQISIICHNIATMSRILDSKTICPNQTPKG